VAAGALRRRQLRVLFARPQFAFLDRLSTALGSRAAAEVLERLEDAGVGLVTFVGAEEPVGHPDAILELDADGSWSVHAPTAGHAAGS
jgi:putative ATP-binding cassette transporter